MLICTQNHLNIISVDKITVDIVGNYYVVSAGLHEKHIFLGKYKNIDRARLEIKSIVEFFNGNTGRQIYTMTEDK